MSIPVPISTRFGAVSRSKGHQMAARLSYITGTELHSERTGERHYNGRDDVVHTKAEGWPGVSQADQQRLVYDIEEACGPRENAREGQTMIFELAAFEREKTDPVLAHRMQIQRRLMANDAAQWWRERSGAAVVIGVHSDPMEDETGRNLQYHAHLVSSRHHSDGQRLGDSIERFDSYGLNRDLTREFREWAAERNNQIAIKYGEAKRWTHEGYEALYTRLNKERDAEGVEPLEHLEARQHEGMAGTAIRRKRAAKEAGQEPNKPIKSNPAIDQKLSKNDQIATKNAAKRERNAAKLARDEQVKSIGGRVQAHGYLLLLDIRVRGEMGKGNRPLGHYTDDERELLALCKEKRGDVQQLRDAFAELHPDAQKFLAKQHPVGALDIIKDLTRKAEREIDGITKGGRGDSGWTRAQTPTRKPSSP